MKTKTDTQWIAKPQGRCAILRTREVEFVKGTDPHEIFKFVDLVKTQMYGQSQTVNVQGLKVSFQDFVDSGD